MPLATWKRSWCVLTALAIACAKPPATREQPRNDEFGSPADVRAQAGMKHDYTVVTCVLGSYRAFYVESTDSAVDGGPIVPAVGGFMTGLGMGCKGMGRIINVFSWRAVDSMIEAVGRSLAAAGSREVVTIMVSGRPEPH